MRPSLRIKRCNTGNFGRGSWGTSPDLGVLTGRSQARRRRKEELVLGMTPGQNQLLLKCRRTSHGDTVQPGSGSLMDPKTERQLVETWWLVKNSLPLATLAPVSLASGSLATSRVTMRARSTLADLSTHPDREAFRTDGAKRMNLKTKTSVLTGWPVWYSNSLVRSVSDPTAKQPCGPQEARATSTQ